MPETVFSQQAIDDLPQRKRANFINSLSGFKSANLIGTRSKSGINNLAVVSSVVHIGANPPLLGMIMRPHTVVRDSLSNIKETGVFTINHVNANIVEQAHQSSARYEPSQDEFVELGLGAQMSGAIEAPYVAESCVKLSLELAQINLIELNQTEMVIGKIVEVVTDDAFILEDGYVDIEKANSLTISGLDSYHQTSRIDRFSYAKPEQTLQSIWQEKHDT